MHIRAERRQRCANTQKFAFFSHQSVIQQAKHNVYLLNYNRYAKFLLVFTCKIDNLH